MRRQRGFTLIELMVVTATFGTVTGAFLALANSVRQEERLSAHCSEDLQDLRRAVRILETELRTARGPEDLSVRHAHGTLRRGEAVLARNVERFRLSWERDRVLVQVTLGARSDSVARREASLEFTVLRRPRKEGS